MFPSLEQVRTTAYHRWERRGYEHGYHHEDWLAAEQTLLFHLNYQVVAAYPPGGLAPLGRGRLRVCRFCEQAEPRTHFRNPAPALPDCLGLDGLHAFDQCDDCRALFRDGLDDALADFLGRLQDGAEPSGVPIAVYKALARSALAILPGADLDLFPDAIEWICNPDHDLDGRSFAGMGCDLYQGPGLPAHSWVALAWKTDEEAAMPSAIAFLGTPGQVFVLPLPLCSRDEDLEGESLTIPRVPLPDEPMTWRGPIFRRFLPIAAAPKRRRLAALGAY